MQLTFSPDDQYLASVSRDRQFCLFSRDKPSNKFSLTFSDKSHARVIWSVSFSHDSSLIATGSRDKKVKFWKIDKAADNGKCHLVFDKQFKDGVTAVAFADRPTNNKAYLVAVGLETGEIEFFEFSPDAKSLSTLGKIPEHFIHSLSINRIKFRRVKNEEEGKFVVATCAEDHSTRIFSLNF